MPIHDWTRVGPGVFHDFHTVWIGALRNALNQGILPPDYYAQAEQVAGDIGPDALTLHSGRENGPPAGSSALAVDVAPPQVQYTLRAETGPYVDKQRRLAIRHASDDRIVALLEILSPGNKDAQARFDQFLDKAREAVRMGIHLLLIDLFPPTPRDPEGIHGAIWPYVSGENWIQPEDRPLTLAAYKAGPMVEAFIEPTAVGSLLKPMPLFFHPRWYVLVPLEETYAVAWDALPAKYRNVLA